MRLAALVRRPPDTAPPEQQSSALLRLPHDIRLLVWEEAVGKRYLHLAQSYSGPHTPPAPAAAFQPGQGQQQHYRGYYGQRCLECHPACYHCTLLAATEFVDFDVRLAARRRANADVRGVAAVVLVCRLVYNEAVPFLYKSNTFQFTSPRTLSGLHQSLRPPRWNAIRTLHLHWSFRAPLFAHYDALMQQLRGGARAISTEDDTDRPPITPSGEASTTTADGAVLSPADLDEVVADAPPFDPTLDSMLYWHHPLLESMPSMEIDRAHWEWEHWRDACQAVAGDMRGLRDFRVCLRTGLVAAPGQMVLFLSPLRGLRLAAAGSGAAAAVVGAGGELVETGVQRRGGAAGADGAVGEGGEGRLRWKLGLLCGDRDAWAVQQALDKAGFACDVSRLVAQYWPPELQMEPPPFNVQYRR
ncbi:hypothetical protein GTA08_BOTSDO04400 [Neofusicoccum parvum]|uniref:Uncharacterized protein n=1 Tax=Neofusicoccum parvum TaxID=310453 RepID=A0ACB5S782_9PEZI|nr:hypothetical protein GTA08_BOTSDO04400 [Neofusicoccum parvum]